MHEKFYDIDTQAKVCIIIIDYLYRRQYRMYELVCIGRAVRVRVYVLVQQKYISLSLKFNLLFVVGGGERGAPIPRYTSS